MKEIYLAGKIETDESRIDNFSKELEQRGHIVLEKWWEYPKLPTPYLDNVATSTKAANAMVKAAFESDVMILFPSYNILGAAVELGAAEASSLENPYKQVIIVNPFDTRQSVFYTHKSVNAVQGIEQIREMDWF